MIMRRMKMLTLGFFLILFGIQLNLVDRVELTPRFSTLLSENGSTAGQHTDPNQASSTISQASFRQAPAYTPPFQVTPRISIVPIPKWLCWPTMFLGAVFVLQGAIKPD